MLDNKFPSQKVLHLIQITIQNFFFFLFFVAKKNEVDDCLWQIKDKKQSMMLLQKCLSTKLEENYEKN